MKGHPKDVLGMNHLRDSMIGSRCLLLGANQAASQAWHSLSGYSVLAMFADDSPGLILPDVLKP